MHRKVTCDSESFMSSNICAHATAVAFQKECLYYFIASWQPNLRNIIDPAVAEKSGAKMYEIESKEDIQKRSYVAELSRKLARSVATGFKLGHFVPYAHSLPLFSDLQILKLDISYL